MLAEIKQTIKGVSFKILLLMLFPLFLVGCGGGGGGTSTPPADNGGSPSGEIQGTIVAAPSISFKAGSPIHQAITSGTVGVPGAVCTIEGTNKSATTGQDGSFTINGIDSGSHILICKKTAVDGTVYAFLKIVEVPSGQQGTGSILDIGTVEITATGHIQGKAMLTSQADHTGITVYIPGTSFQAMTDAVGAYLMSNIPEGTYGLRFEKSGHAAAILSGINVTAGQTTLVGDLVLNLSTGATGSLIIENGNAHSASQTVTISITASTDAALMQISEDPNFVGATWIPLSSTMTWTFASDGEKRLYIKFADANGLESAPVSDSIIIDTTPPAAPTGVTATVGDTQVTISWTAVTGATSYNLYWMPTSPVTKTTGFKITGVTSPYAHTGLTNGTTYYYVITAVDIGGESVESAQVSATPQSHLGTWVAKAPMLTARYGMGIGVVNGILYAIGGIGEFGKGPLATVEAYDPTTDTWTTKAPMPTARIYVAVGVINNVIYAVGGYDAKGNIFSAVEAYDPATNTWTTKTPMPTARYSHTVAVANGILYAMGGVKGDGTHVSPPVEAYDPTINTWTTKAPMPTDRYHLTASGVDSLIYAVGGGANGVDVLSVTEAYDPVTNTWTTKASMPTARYGHAASIVKGLLYAMGGDDARGSTTFATVEAYDPAADTWVIKAPMHTARQLLSAGVIKNVIYAVGGFNENGPLDTVEAYTPPTTITAITAGGGGGGQTCVSLSNGTVKCWGTNLGDGTSNHSPTPVTVTGITTGTAVIAWNGHTCALLQEGAVKCWGMNNNGQLGDGTTTDALTPVTVSGITTAMAVAAGRWHTCTLLQDGTVQCWGMNNNGELGDGTTVNRPTPVAATGITTATAVAAGGQNTCALLLDSTVMCWGDNSGGQLGDGTKIDSSTPVPVNGITTATAISVGSSHACALLIDGMVKCWGNNSRGQLGDGTTIDSSTPVSVHGITTATSVSAGTLQTCAVLSNSTVQCWGHNAFGELGNGTLDNSSVPVAVTGITTATAISAGNSHTCAVVLSNGDLRCWGGNGSGELGDGNFISSSTPVQVVGIP